ncbi:alpha-tocopherol transfer protein-like [Trichogramma pretiosum]|uniref:alpha-tocopherol transfer protein-like n=1 Tax=Trichogramma pretiosum TaxID=7493 RepID=UPI0006C95D29|nr:alpha-tocopherol transfer protein-like [Trichogramma pretiosum]
MSGEWVTPEDDYDCQLSEETQKMAKDELREDKNTRDQALEQLRSWLKLNPRVENSRMDARFLLRFLRCKKFNVPMAQEAIERYLLLRQVYQPAFHNLDVKEKNMEELLALGYIFAVPGRDPKGRRVIVARPGVFDPYKYTNADMCKIHGLTYEALMEDEESQVRGFVHFADGAGVSFPHLTLFTPKEAVRIVKNGERTLPMRHKEVHAINVHPSLKFALDFGMSLISEKIRSRVTIYTSLDDAKEKGMDCSMLPKEYGGTIPMKEMINAWREELMSLRMTLLSHDKMRVRPELYSEKAREGAVSALKQGFNCSTVSTGESTMHGICGSFRKLEVD